MIGPNSTYSFMVHPVIVMQKVISEKLLAPVGYNYTLGDLRRVYDRALTCWLSPTTEAWEDPHGHRSTFATVDEILAILDPTSLYVMDCLDCSEEQTRRHHHHFLLGRTKVTDFLFFFEFHDVEGEPTLGRLLIFPSYEWRWMWETELSHGVQQSIMTVQGRMNPQWLDCLCY